MFRVTDVVKHLLIINVLMFFGTGLLNSHLQTMLAVFFPTSPFFQPYQLVTHLFMHGDITHLFFNMFALYMFGSPLEALWGPRRFLFYYFFSGFGALALHLLVMYVELSSGALPPEMINIPMLGASGAVFGLLAGYGTMFPNSVLQLLFPPVAMKAKYFVVLYAVVELVFGVGNMVQGVAHFAHVGGALFGFLLILYWRKFGRW